MPQLAGFVEGLQLAVLPGKDVQVGHLLIIGLDEDRRPALFNCHTEEACLVDPPPAAAAAAPPSKAPLSLLQSALQCVHKERISCYGQVTAVEGSSATMRLAILLPDGIWAGRHRWAATPAAAQLFMRLAALPPPCDGGGEQQETQQQQQHASYWQHLQQQLGGVRPPPESTDPFSLAACFQALPMRGQHAVVPPLVVADPAQPCRLAQLDQPLLLSVLIRLDRRSLVAAAAACRHLRELTRDVAPGLKLSLFPHQRIAVMWMQGREAASPAAAAQQQGQQADAVAAPHPFIHPICCSEVEADSAAAAFSATAGPGLPLWLDAASGEVVTEAPPALRAVRGGLFADEPGLGKTITALALILRTLGTLPAAPAGLEATCTQPGRSYYSLPRAEAASAATMTRSRSSRASLRRTRSSGPVPSDPASEAVAEELLAAGKTWAANDPLEIARQLKRQRRSASADPEGPPAAGAAAAAAAAGASVAAAAPAPEQPDAAAAAAGQGQEQAAALLQETWVQCELCQKWRRLAPGHKAPSGDFVCPMNPDEALQWQGCAAPEEEWGAGEGGARVLFCPGWVEEGKQQGAQHNVAFYRRLLQQHPQLTDRASPLAWLARQRLGEVMHKPFTLETELCRDFPGFSAAFRQMELEPVVQQQQRAQPERRSAGRGRGRGRGVASSSGAASSGGRGRGRGRGRRRKRYALGTSSEEDEASSSSSGFSSDEDESEDWGARYAAGLEDDGSGGGSGSSSGEEGESGAEEAPAPLPQQQQQRRQRRGRRGGRGGTAEPARWRRPATHAALVLDQQALRQALAEELVPPPHRIFLSQATLVVVPPELIDHWRTQIRLHVQVVPGQQSGLRVLVYTTEERDAARRAGRELTPQRLAWEADIVLTTFDTMSSEWRPREPIECSPLMQVHWLRIILDEGHKVGSVAMTNKLQMAVCLHAERRWVMTGTPTPNTPDASVDKLQPLLAFLQHQPYGSEPESWKRAVQAPFERREEVGRLRLLALLNQIMIRASKAELVNLGIPPLHFKETVLDFAPDHASSWNQFVDIVRFNLMTSDWYDDSHRESLLNAANAKRAQQTLNNLRMSCNVSGNCKLQVQDSDVEETLQLLSMRQLAEQGREVPCSPTAGTAGTAGTSSAAAAPAHKQEQQAALAPLAQLLEAAGREWAARAAHIRACLQEGGACDRCAAVVRVLCVAPCACLLCVDCASSQRTACPKCAQPYRMQPVDDPGRLADNPHPKWEVPLELIEWQPAYTQRGAKGIEEGTWQPEWQVTRSTKCTHLLRRLLEVGAAVPPGSGRHVSCKAIVYTQFWSHMLLLEAYLRRHGVRPAVLKRGMQSQAKQDALSLFRHSPHVGVLLMDRSGQVGLDLSFASHVFLMEPIFNGADEEQVVSRAHRMGAKQPVQVEILAMRGTVEERMLLSQRQEGRRPPGSGAAPLPAPAPPAAGPTAPAGRQGKGEAARREERNEYLRSLRPVPVLDLPAFEDLPGGEDEAAQAESEERRRAAAVVAAQQRQAAEEEEEEEEQQQLAGGGSQAEGSRGAAVSAAAAAAAAQEEQEEDEEEVGAVLFFQSSGAVTARPAPSPATARPPRQPTWPEVAAGGAGRAAGAASPATKLKAAPGSAAPAGAAVAGGAGSLPAYGRPAVPHTVRFAAVEVEKEHEGEARQEEQQRQSQQARAGPPAGTATAPAVKAEVEAQQAQQAQQQPQAQPAQPPPQAQQARQAQQAQLAQQPPQAQQQQPTERSIAGEPVALHPAIKPEPEQEEEGQVQAQVQAQAQVTQQRQSAKRPVAAEAGPAAAAGQAVAGAGDSSPGGGRPSKRRRAVRFAEPPPTGSEGSWRGVEAEPRQQTAPQQPEQEEGEEKRQQQHQQHQQELAGAAAMAAPVAVAPSAVARAAPPAEAAVAAAVVPPAAAAAPPAAAAAAPAAAAAAPPAAAAAAPAAAAAAPSAAAAAAPPAAAPPAGSPVDVVVDLLDQAGQSAAAQAVGLTKELAGSFSGAFYEMNAAHQQRHAQRLIKLLQQGKHAMVAAHIRACLQRQGVLPAAGAAAGRGPAAAEASAEGSGVG